MGREKKKIPAENTSAHVRGGYTYTSDGVTHTSQNTRQSSTWSQCGVPRHELLNSNFTFAKFFQTNDEFGVHLNSSARNRTAIPHAGCIRGYIPDVRLVYQAGEINDTSL